MPRTMTEIKAHLRAVIANESISTTLIQTEDLAALCDEADEAESLRAKIGELEDNLSVYQANCQHNCMD